MRFSTVLVFLILSMIGCTVDQTIATEAPDDPIGLDHPWRAFKGCYVACQLPTESGIVKATDGWSIWRQNMTTSERSPAVKLEGPLPKSVFVNHVFSLDGSWLARTDGSEVTIYHGESGKRFYSGSPIGPSGIPVRLPDSAYDSSWQRGGFYPVYLAFVADRTLLAANSRGYAAISLKDGRIQTFTLFGMSGRDSIQWDHVWPLSDGTIVYGWTKNKDDFGLALIPWSHPEELRELPIDREEARAVELSRDQSKLLVRVAVRNPYVHFGPPEGFYMNHRIEVFDRKTLISERRINFQSEDSSMMHEIPRNVWTLSRRWLEATPPLEECVRWLMEINRQK